MNNFLSIISTVLKSTDGASFALSSLQMQANENRAIIEAVKYDTEGAVTRILINSDPPLQTHFLNGVIIDRRGRIVCRPPKRLTVIGPDEFMRIIADRTVAEPEIIEAANATMVSLYHCDSGWVLSTSRSIEADKFIPMGNIPLRSVFDTLMKANGLMDDTGIHLNSGRSYTFLISHPSYHITPQNELHFICCWDIDKQVYCNPEPELERLRQFKTSLTPEQIVDRVSCSADRLAEQKYAGSFGFVIRQINPDLPDYYLASDVTDFLRNYIYHAYREIGLEPSRRQMYVTLKLCLVRQQHERIFLGLQVDTPMIGILTNVLQSTQALYKYYCETSCARIPGYSVESFYDMAAQLHSKGIGSADMMKLEYIHILWPFINIATIHWRG